MNTRLVISIALVSFILLAVFGLYVPLVGHAEHGGCPFAFTMCVMALTHIEHWQVSVTAIVMELVVLFAAVVVIFVRSVPPSPGSGRYWLRIRVPVRPTILEELFSQGILRRKEPLM